MVGYRGPSHPPAHHEPAHERREAGRGRRRAAVARVRDLADNPAGHDGPLWSLHREMRALTQSASTSTVAPRSRRRRPREETPRKT
jgi:hypothetical protein